MSKRGTLMKCQTVKAPPKQLRKAKSFYQQADKFVMLNTTDQIEEKLKKLEQSFHNQSDNKLSQTHNRYTKSNSVTRKRGGDTIIPEWMKSRKDFQQICYTKTIEDLFSVPKIILKQQRNAIEDQKIRDWIQNIVKGLPEELYKELCSIIQTRVFEDDDVFDVDHNISILYEGKVIRMHKDLGFPLNGTLIKVGDFLNDEYMYMVKQDAIIVDLPKIELMQILDDFKILKLDQFVQQMRNHPAFSQFKKNSLHKIITRGQLQLIIKNYHRNQRISNQEYLNILFYGKLQLNLRKQISKVNKWPIAQKKWETKVYYQFHDKVLELEPVNCFGLTDDQYTISTRESCVLLQIRRNILEEKILTTEQINDLKQSIDIFKQESKIQWRERMRRRFDTELEQQKVRMEKIMIALLKN